MALTLQDVINKIGAKKVSSDLQAQGIKPYSPTSSTSSPKLSSLTAPAPKAPVYNTMTLTDAASSWNPLSLQGDGGGMAGELNGGVNAPAYQAYLAQQAKTQQFQNQIIPDQYKDSPYASYFSNVAPLDYEQSKYQFFPGGGYSTADEGGMYHDTEKTNQLDYLDAYKKISVAPMSVSIPELLKLNPQAANFSPEVQKAFADNYRLGYASLYKPVYGDNVMPTSQGNINLLKNGKSNYLAIDPANLSKTYWDPKLGLQIDKKYVVEPTRNNFISSIAPIMASVVAPGIGTALGSALGIGSSTLSSALAGGALGGLTSGLSGGNPLTGALTGGIGGAITGSGVLDSLSSTANIPDVSSLNTGLDFSNIDDLIQGGSITSGQGASALVNAAPVGTNIAGVAGGALNPALSAGAGALSNLATSDLASLANNFQSPSSISTVGESTGLNNTGTGLSDVPTGQITNLGTDMITSPENLQSLVNSSPIGSELLPGTPGTTGGYLNPTMAAGSGVAAAAQGTGSITDYISNLFNSGVDNFMKDPVKNTGTLLSGLVSYLQGQGQAGDLSNLLKNSLAQADPFGSQRAYYAQRLKDTYTNPVGVQKSPEYQAVHARELDALERADAAQGRRSQYGARAEKMDQNFMEYLNKERSTLAGLAGSGISPSQVANLSTTLGVGSSNAQVNSTGQLMFALNQLLNGGK